MSRQYVDRIKMCRHILSRASPPFFENGAMLAEIYPLQVLLMTFSGLVNRHQAEVIAYLVEAKRVGRP